MNFKKFDPVSLSHKWAPSLVGKEGVVAEVGNFPGIRFPQRTYPYKVRLLDGKEVLALDTSLWRIIP